MRSAGGSSNGRTAAFEAVNLGSIPSPPAERISHVRLKVGQAFEAVNLVSSNSFNISA